MHAGRFRGIVHGCAIWGRCNTRSTWCIWIDERSVKSPRATNAVYGAVLQAPFDCKGISACV